MTSPSPSRVLAPGAAHQEFPAFVPKGRVVAASLVVRDPFLESPDLFELALVESIDGQPTGQERHWFFTGDVDVSRAAVSQGRIAAYLEEYGLTPALIDGKGSFEEVRSEVAHFVKDAVVVVDTQQTARELSNALFDEEQRDQGFDCALDLLAESVVVVENQYLALFGITWRQPLTKAVFETHPAFLERPVDLDWMLEQTGIAHTPRWMRDVDQRTEKDLWMLDDARDLTRLFWRLARVDFDLEIRDTTAPGHPTLFLKALMESRIDGVLRLVRAGADMAARFEPFASHARGWFDPRVPEALVSRLQTTPDLNAWSAFVHVTPRPVSGNFWRPLPHDPGKLDGLTILMDARVPLGETGVMVVGDLNQAHPNLLSAFRQAVTVLLEKKMLAAIPHDEPVTHRPPRL
jgi:hypothetical protein